MGHHAQRRRRCTLCPLQRLLLLHLPPTVLNVLRLLQRDARRHTQYLHAPGTQLIEEGVDGLPVSRDAAVDIAGPVSSPLVRERATRLARSLGWELSVDAFASATNTLLPRFVARCAEPLAEAGDALEVGDWPYSTCPACGQSHRETLFAFPPSVLLNRFVTKARADEIRLGAIVVTPLAVSAPYWSKLLRASVVINKEGNLRV